jgi:hypothetical protein
MNYDKVKDELESMNGINNVRDGSTGRVKAIDFNIYKMDRKTGASNFVFSRFGFKYKNGLLRLPRVRKESIERAELKKEIYHSINSTFHDKIFVRLEPEVELDEDYHYPHIEIDQPVIDAIKIVSLVIENYNPLELKH